jgi:hypothetical protein
VLDMTRHAVEAIGDPDQNDPASLRHGEVY